MPIAIAKEKHADLQEFLNDGEHSRRYGAALARQRSGVRVFSRPVEHAGGAVDAMQDTLGNDN
jgi:hypothetical protein